MCAYRYSVSVSAPAIKIQSPGPVFFSQIRVGKNGKKFKLYKFRSMYTDAEERKAQLATENRVTDGLMFKLDFDPRIIGCRQLPDGTVKKGIGNFIRDWSFDEFPQFMECLKGGHVSGRDETLQRMSGSDTNCTTEAVWPSNRESPECGR